MFGLLPDISVFVFIRTQMLLVASVTSVIVGPSTVIPPIVVLFRMQ